MNEIQPSLLIENIDKLSPILCDIFNACFRRGQYPNAFKVARVIPVFKAGNTNDVANYRPISTPSIFNKIGEILMNNRVGSFIKENCILTEHQFGFRQGSSTTLGILELLSFILGAINVNILLYYFVFRFKTRF